MTNYEYNSCGVVTNPTVIFKYANPKFLAWDYYQIKIGKCLNGLWNFGYNVAGSGGPVCYGQYNSFQEAELEAIKYLKNVFDKPLSDCTMGNKTCFTNAKNKFQEFLSNKMVYNSHLAKQINYTSTIQLALF